MRGPVNVSIVVKENAELPGPGQYDLQDAWQLSSKQRGMKRDRNSLTVLPPNSTTTVAERVAEKTRKPKFVLIADNITLETELAEQYHGTHTSGIESAAENKNESKKKRPNSQNNRD